VNNLEKKVPVCNILEKLILSASEPISIEELAAQVNQNWGRNFPTNPYQPIALIYKLLANHSKVELLFDEADGPIMAPHGPEGKGILPLSPNLEPEELNKISEQLKKIKVRMNA
jgi:hypothetical protein